MRRALLFLLVAVAAGAEIIDGVAAIVGRRPITHSDVSREARLEDFFNGRPARNALPAAEKRGVLERLIEQRLLLQEMEQTSFPPSSGAEAKQWLAQRLESSGDPAAWGLRPADLLDYARRQRDIVFFVDFRFQPPQAEGTSRQERANQMLEQWLGEQRTRVRIEILEANGR